MKQFLLALFLITNVCAFASTGVDLIIFSFNRPLQLQALLESVEHYVTGLSSVHVIYRTTSERAAQCYHQLTKQFPSVNFTAQSSNPHSDFKLLSQAALDNSESPYVLFAVDDIIVKDYISLQDAISIMQDMNAYGFYLRMGLHLDYCYTMNKPQRVPAMHECVPGVYYWTFAGAEHDWGYPNTVDMTIYKKSDIMPLFSQLPYYTPNSLEGLWSMHAGAVQHRIGLCYSTAKMVNLPLNQVQTDGANRNMEILGPDEQIALFEQGKKLDWKKLYLFDNKSAHMAYIPNII
ncbi:hypothetical protein Noda2021_07380 [Candidatus Dependentiae bacterium Noda2021]|nr:hypothetical protein Noda2021_07380 [Candidatus Dependentiae bacterium Noda2021]